MGGSRKTRWEAKCHNAVYLDVEVVKVVHFLDLLCKHCSQDLLMDWAWDLKGREQSRKTARLDCAMGRMTLLLR